MVPSEKFFNPYPKEPEERRCQMEFHFSLLKDRLRGIEGKPYDLVDLNKEFDYKTMGFAQEVHRKNRKQRTELKEIVEFFVKHKEDISLLTLDEQKSLNDLLIRSKLYLAAYKKE